MVRAHMDLHANVRAWQREEDGSYKAEIEGLTLHVTWRPENPEGRRGFLWKIEGQDGSISQSEHVEEEIELAMAHAEKAAHIVATKLATPLA